MQASHSDTTLTLLTILSGAVKGCFLTSASQDLTIPMAIKEIVSLPASHSVPNIQRTTFKAPFQGNDITLTNLFFKVLANEVYPEYHWVILNKFTPSLQYPNVFELLHYYQGISSTFFH